MEQSSKITVLFVSLLLLFGSNLYSQEASMTPYERKREQLCTEAMEKLMNTMSSYDRTLFAVNLQNALREAHEEGDVFKETAIGEIIIFKLCDISEGLQTEANLLASSLDISDVYAGRSLQEWNEIGRWYKQERAKLEKTKTAEDVRREKERADALRDEPGIAGVKKRVAKEFKKWAKKGELEKTAAWQERMKVRGTEVFDSLCFVCVNTQINANLLWKKLGDYDADREGVDWRYYYEDENGQIRSFVDGFWPITVKQVQRGIGDWDRDRTYAKGIFLKGVDIYPATYHLAMAYEWDIRLGDPQSILIAMTDVVGDLSEAVDANHSFDYSQYSQNLVTYDYVVTELNRLLHETKDKYKTVYAYSHEEYLPYVSSFYTKQQVEQILAPLQNKVNDIEKGKVIIRDLHKVFKREYGCDTFAYQFSENGDYYNSQAQRVGQYDQNQLTSLVVEYAKGDTRLLETISYLTPEQQEFLREINKFAIKYNLNLDSFFNSLMLKSTYYQKKYKKMTQEEALKRFKEEINRE